MSSGLPRSVQTRLVRHAHALELDPNLVLARYATERFLYRLSRSPHAERFVLKGALMLLVWLGETIRPTRDADLLGFGDLDPVSLRKTIAEACDVAVDPDGLEFDAGSIRVDRIRPGDDYGGLRTVVWAHLGPARLRVQVDVGVGDAVVPEPEWIEYPSLLELPRPRLRAYRPETAIAEKVHAMVELGSRNSRIRDYFDVDALASRETFDGAVMAASIAATFTRRRTMVPRELPLGLTREFAAVEGKAAQWAAFTRRLPNHLDVADLVTVLERVGAFVGPVLLATGRDEHFAARWPPGGPWR
jgi:predicted nucleotidyltransferase component of viral defense system